MRFSSELCSPCSKMRGRLASEIIFQQWLQTQNRRHLSAWVVPTKVQHKGFSFYFWEDVMLCCVVVEALRLTEAGPWPKGCRFEFPGRMIYLFSWAIPLRCLWAKHFVSPVELCTGLSKRVWLYWAAPRLDEWKCVNVMQGVAGKKRACVLNFPRKVKNRHQHRGYQAAHTSLKWSY